MNAIELKCARIRRRKSAKELAPVIGVTAAAYSKREQGVTPFSLKEACSLSRALELSEEEFITVFFDGVVPYRKGTASSGDIAPQNDQE